MAGETILIIDADESLEQRITAPLEKAGYLVFTASSQVLNPDALGKLSPSAIYIRPLSPTAAGFKPCKTIHDLPGMKDVPIVLLAPLKELDDPRFFTVYGITDSLKPSFLPYELVEKTKKILGKTSSPPSPQGDEGFAIEGVEEFRATPSAAEIKPDDLRLTEKDLAELALPQKRMPPVADKSLDKGEGRQPKLPVNFRWLNAFGQMREKNPSRFWLAVGVAVLLIAGLCFMAYEQFAPAGKVVPIRSAKARPSVPPKTPGVQPAAQTSPETKAADPAPSASAGAAPAPPTPATVPKAPAAASASLASPPATLPSPPSPQKPSPPPEAAAQVPRKVSYYVQLGAFKNETFAQDLVKELRGKGYEAIAKPGATEGASPMYRVFVGKFEDRKAAENLAREIHSKEGIKTTLYRE